MKLEELYKFLGSFWKEFEPVFELFIYLGIAWSIQKLFGLTYIQALLVILVYFLVNVLRVIVERKRNQL
jgi:uncharacterized membrane protein YjjP (DUF1212 family)